MKALEGIRSSGHDACAVRADLHPAAGVVRRRRDQGRAPGRRHHARPAARSAGRRQPLFHDAERQQALDHAGHQESQGPRAVRQADSGVRRHGRELRAGRDRSHGLPLGEDPGAQPAHDLRLGQGLRTRAVRGLQGVRERRAVHRRRRLDHRLRRWPAAGDRRPDRRHRHGVEPRARHRHRAVPAREDRARPAGARRHAGRRAQPLPGQAARPAAPRPRAAEGVSAVSSRRVRRGDPALGQRVRRGSTGLDRQVQGLGDRSQRLHLRDHPGPGLAGAVQGHRPGGVDRGSRLCHRRRPPRQARPHLRHDRGMDQDQDQVRGHGHPE